MKAIKIILLSGYFIILISHFHLLFAGNTGKITGTVKDIETGDLLPGVNIVVNGTSMGAVSNHRGEFLILNVSAGKYTIEARLIGYQIVKKEGVLILSDFTTQVNFELSPSPLSGEDIVVFAERPMIQRDQTMTMSVIASDEIKNMPLRGFQAVAGLTPGFISGNTRSVEGGNANVYVRGGRPEELGVYIDGFQQNNLVTGVANAQVPSGAIEEMVTITGAYDAEYGRFQSGILQVTTKKGGSNYGGFLEYVNDQPMRVLDKDHYFGYNVYSGGIGGPIIPGKEQLKFFISAEGRDIADAEPSVIGFPKFVLSSDGAKKNDPSLADTVLFQTDDQGNLLFQKGPRPKNSAGYGINSDRGIALQTKITWQAIPAVLRIDASGNYSETYRRSSIITRILTPDNNYRHEIKNLNLGAITTYTINDKSYADFALNYHSNDRKRMNDRLGFDLSQYNQSLHGNTNSFTYYDDGLLYDIDGTGGAFSPRWYQDSYVAIKAGYSNQINRQNLLQAGGDVFIHQIRFLDDINVANNPPSYNGVGWMVNTNYQIVKVNQNDLESGLLGPARPVSASCFVQNQLVTDGLTVRSGIRLDIFNSGIKRVKNFHDPTGQYDSSQFSCPNQFGRIERGSLGPEDYQPAINQYHISPRLSVSFPVSEVMQFRLSYGQFSQQPNLEFLYVGPDALERASNNDVGFIVGNPNLKPERITQYEVGIRRLLKDKLAVDVSLYYKDIENLISYTYLPSVPNSIKLFDNSDEGVVKGLDLSIELRRTGKFQGRLTYSLQAAKGTGNSGYVSRLSGDRSTKVYAPLAFDRRHNINATIDIRNAKAEGPFLGGQRWLENAGVNILLNASSGLPYTHTTVGNLDVRPSLAGSLTDGSLNGQNMPWSFRVDLKADKTFSVVSRFTLNVYVQILNFFNRRNVLNVFGSTGRPDNNGFIDRIDIERQRQQYLVWYHDGFNYDTPRQIRFGIILNF